MNLIKAAENQLEVEFQSHGVALSGVLFLPNDYQAGKKVPGVVVTGSRTSVKEQMPRAYAKALADRGFAALTFDFRGWGESPDKIPYLEDPKRKTEDIVAALDYLATRDEIDAGQIGGLGICASAGYMSDAALQSQYLSSLALVAPWLHDMPIVEAVYGGKEGVNGLLALGKQAAEAAEPVLIEAASSTNDKALMYQAPYYTETDRGLIDAYDNRFNVASWGPWLEYDAISGAAALNKPTLLVHSEQAAIPQGAKKYAAKRGDEVELVWIDGASQFDFYDKPELVAKAADAAADHFAATMEKCSDWVTTYSRDEARVWTVIDAIGPLADLHEFDALGRLYAERVEYDYTSVFGGEVELKSSAEQMKQWAAFLPGFDLTKHTIWDIEVEVMGDKAVATSKVVGDHWVDDLYWKVEGRYRFELIKIDGEWKISAHQLLLDREGGTRDVFAAAMAKG
ncbi:MAG: alpha/beta fold hydrolase [Verrucomicrobiota bacterium]